MQSDLYLNGTLAGGVSSTQEDDSKSANTDLSPSTSDGMVFDEDSPGVDEPSSVPASPGSLRFRTNFQEWATIGSSATSPGGANQIGSAFNLYARGSCNEASNATLTLDNTYAGDNQAAAGQTALSVNLQ